MDIVINWGERGASSVTQQTLVIKKCRVHTMRTNARSTDQLLKSSNNWNNAFSSIFSGPDPAFNILKQDTIFQQLAVLSSSGANA
jgi:hypothetical protein